MRILVTGAAGYFGSVLVFELLRHGHEVRGVDALIYGPVTRTVAEFSRQYEFIEADLRNEDRLEQALEGIDHVIHLAALVGHPICNQDPALSEDINTRLTARLIEAARAGGIGRFLQASTCSNYGTTPSGVRADESTPLNPVSVYAATKVSAEERVLSAASDTFYPTVFRFATLFGLSPRMRFDLLLNELTRDAWISRRIVLRGADTWRPFLHVEDAAAAVIAWLETPAAETSGVAFNISGFNVRKRDVGELLRQNVPNLAVEIDEREDDPRDYSVSIERARRVLRFSSRHTALEGVTAMLAALRAGQFTDPMSARYTNLPPRSIPLEPA